MLDRVTIFFAKPSTLLLLLVLQTVVYWLLAIYLGSDPVPVAYQRF
jgi:hypothetical protein